MKLRIGFIFLFLCAITGFAFGINVSDIVGERFEETQGRGLVVRTNPVGVKVFIDGVERGLTPLTLDNLASGEHHVRLSRDGYKDRVFSVTLFSGSALVVSIEMEELRGLALVSVYRAQGSPAALEFNPQVTTAAISAAGAEVSLSHDNKALLNLSAGFHTIRARAFGWEDASVSVLVNEHSAIPADIFMTPAALRMGSLSQSRRRFNPLNSNNLGTVEFRFEVSAPAAALVRITDKNANIVFEKQLENFETWHQSFTWNGRDSEDAPLPEGVYTVLIQAQDSKLGFAQIIFNTEINYSLNIFPLSLAPGAAGLTFAPAAKVLPSGSYQLEANINYGNFPDKGFPFGMGLRLSPANNLEVTTLFNVNPDIENTTGWGITGSVKYNFLDTDFFALAAGVFYTWAVNEGESPLSPGRGAGFVLPLSFEVKKFSFIFSPSVFWQGPEGLQPCLHLGAGVLYCENWFNAGLSMRAEMDFENSSTRFLTGAEARFYPSPSNFYFGFQTGAWFYESETGAYGGLNIGLIY